MSRKNLRYDVRALLFAFTLITAAGIGGCNSQGGEVAGAGESQSPDAIRQQIQKIQNDPTMPPAAKQQALAGLQQALAQQQQQTESNSAAASARKKAEGEGK